MSWFYLTSAIVAGDFITYFCLAVFKRICRAYIEGTDEFEARAAAEYVAQNKKKRDAHNG
jgi:hypothetical protein